MKKICLPIAVDCGLDSEISGHFGSAPMFILHDAETDQTVALENDNTHDEHGRCHPVKTMRAHNIDTLVVGGLGRRALANMREGGVRVFQAVPGTVRDNLAALKAGQLAEFDDQAACSGHSH
ncbi:NifB/NifX family molybdenum-iron cluster-binding protein [bacterium]|nr:NifB/NifX family molybdenum-iron cluster-binding protein [bacterium]